MKSVFLRVVPVIVFISLFTGLLLPDSTMLDRKSRNPEPTGNSIFETVYGNSGFEGVTTKNLNSSEYLKGKYVAVGDAGTILT